MRSPQAGRPGMYAVICAPHHPFGLKVEESKNEYCLISPHKALEPDSKPNPIFFLKQ